MMLIFANSDDKVGLQFSIFSDCCEMSNCSEFDSKHRHISPLHAFDVKTNRAEIVNVMMLKNNNI